MGCCVLPLAENGFSLFGDRERSVAFLEIIFDLRRSLSHKIALGGGKLGEARLHLGTQK